MRCKAERNVGEPAQEEPSAIWLAAGELAIVGSDVAMRCNSEPDAEELPIEEPAAECAAIAEPAAGERAHEEPTAIKPAAKEHVSEEPSSAVLRKVEPAAKYLPSWNRTPLRDAR